MYSHTPNWANWFPWTKWKANCAFKAQWCGAHEILARERRLEICLHLQANEIIDAWHLDLYEKENLSSHPKAKVSHGPGTWHLERTVLTLYSVIMFLLVTVRSHHPGLYLQWSNKYFLCVGCHVLERSPSVWQWGKVLVDGSVLS